MPTPFLTRLRTLEARATPGPWCYETDDPSDGVYAIGTYTTPDGKPAAGRVEFTDDNSAVRGIARRCDGYDRNDSDFPLVVLLRNSAPRLAALVEAAERVAPVLRVLPQVEPIETFLRALAALDADGGA